MADLSEMNQFQAVKGNKWGGQTNSDDYVMRKPEINFSANLYKSIVFGIQKTDQEIELNESFGFRVKMELDPWDLLKIEREEDFLKANVNYDAVPFYLEAQLYTLKWKFCDMSSEEI